MSLIVKSLTIKIIYKKCEMQFSILIILCIAIEVHIACNRLLKKCLNTSLLMLTPNKVLSSNKTNGSGPQVLFSFIIISKVICKDGSTLEKSVNFL